MEQIFDELLKNVTQGNALGALTQQVGGDSDSATTEAVKMVLPALFGALSRNASSPAGADSLLGALDRDHDGSVLDDLVGAIAGSGGGGGINAGGILEHMLGSRRGGLEAQLGQETGFSGSQITKLLIALAPLVMGALGKAQREQRMGSQELGYELGRVSKHAEESLGDRFGVLGNLLDQDGDGRLDPGVVQMGKSLLGKLFRR